jgi:ribokinase
MITVLGSNSLDFIGAVPRFPGPGETVLGGTFAMAPGGKGANQALAARRAGAEVRMIAATGSDPFGPEALRLLREGGVDLAGLKMTEAATGIAMIFVEASGENAIAVLPGANGTLDPADAERALAGLGIGSILMLQQEIPQAANSRALELARERGVISILNTAPYLESTRSVAEQASMVVANETEFALLSGAAPDRLDAAMAEWAKAQNQTIIVTLGAEGARAATPSGSIAVPSPRITPVDTVGAGDTFCGYLAAGLDRGLDLEAAMRRAAVAASLACLAPGAQPSIPHAAAVEAALSQA